MRNHNLHTAAARLVAHTFLDGGLSPELKEIVESVKKEVKDAYLPLDKKTSDLSEIIKGLQEKSVNKQDVTDLEGRLKGVQEEVKKLSEVADKLDEKMAKVYLTNQGGPRQEKSAGQLFSESDSFKSLQKSGAGRSGLVEMKAITNLGLTVDVGDRNLLGNVQRLPMVTMPEEMPMVRNLIPVARTTSTSIEFVRETGYTNNAAPVAELALKPESAISFDMETAPIRTIAHWIGASRQVLDDVPMLTGYIDNRLRYGLAMVEEAQILLGDGTGQNLLGIIPQAATFPASVATSGIPGGEDASLVDIIRWAKLLVRRALYPADAVLLNPTDWATLELLKGTDGAYLYSAFASGAVPRLWGMRIIETNALAEGEFLVGAFNLGATLWDRERAGVEVSTEDRDNFVRNAVTIRAEERVGLTVERPEAFLHGSFTLAA